MNKPNRSSDALYKTIDQVMQETNLCRKTVRTLAEEAGAIIKIGRSLRINVKKLYEHIDNNYGR